MSGKSFVHSKTGAVQTKINHENAIGAKGSAAALFLLLTAAFLHSQVIRMLFLTISERKQDRLYISY
jgi:hypothetical protein